ncbi:uncharacterized protein LOC121866489 isoform X2 [Homarus americanus]|uniref:uncharacterized protein LOC121866489 isoform X2 n=1 Tax=Homarus americanus TaxID=6706 RepID=UPI001C4854C8|nr:uncharacterized protein LOC121866489 isoform X2 [Homarus americanus]
MDIQSCIYYKVRTPIIMAKQNKEVKVKIVDGNFGTMCIYDDEIFFNPPLYQQRYQKVKDKITSVSKGTFTKVVDVGDPKLQFFQYLQAIPGVREIVFLDKDDKTLKDCDYRINPLNTDLYILRELPLNVKAVCGDVTKYDPTLFGSQVVTMIELIEHLEISELHALVKCVFQAVRPNLIIITTPNADFNKYFPGHTPGSFRHWDHKFEWTAEEFRHWCQELIEDNSSYSVEYSGCGLGPDNTYCTQMAFFLLSTEYQEELLSCIVKELLNIDVKDPTCCEEPVKMGEVTEGVAPSVIREDSYKIIAEFDFPLDMRTQEEKDRDFTLGRFYSLINYLLTGERDDKPQLNWGLIPEDTECSLDDTECSLDDTDDELVFFIVQYIKNDEEIVEKQRDNNGNVFYIVDHMYAVLPLKPLTQWVNIAADHDISHSLISMTVAGDCFEITGSGADWQGRVHLVTLSATSSDESFEKSLEDNDEDQDEWFPNDEHCEHMNKQVVGFSNNENTTVNPEADDYWDVPVDPNDPIWN